MCALFLLATLYLEVGIVLFTTRKPKNEAYIPIFPVSNPSIECVGWRRHFGLIILILLFTKPNIEDSGWLYLTKTHITHIVYQPFSRVMPSNYIA